MSSPVKMQGYISFPRQKLPDSKKDDNWFKKNIDFAEHLLTSDVNLRSNFKNKKSNYNLRANIINVKDFEKYINPDNLDLESLPASFSRDTSSSAFSIFKKWIGEISFFKYEMSDKFRPPLSGPISINFSMW